METDIRRNEMWCAGGILKSKLLISKALNDMKICYYKAKLCTRTVSGEIRLTHTAVIHKHNTCSMYCTILYIDISDIFINTAARCYELCGCRLKMKTIRMSQKDHANVVCTGPFSSICCPAHRSSYFVNFCVVWTACFRLVVSTLQLLCGTVDSALTSWWSAPELMYMAQSTRIPRGA